MKKKIQFISLLSSVSFLLFYCQPQKPSAGQVSFVKGNPTLTRGGQTIPLKLKDQVLTGDVIVTDDNSLAIVKFKDNGAVIEIQEKTTLRINSFTDLNRELFMEKGGAWLEVQKLQKNQSFKLKTPTTVAGVRGTKFFTFTLPDNKIGTCHCEGDVEFETTQGGYKKIHNKDYISVVQDGKSILISPEEMKKAKIPVDETHQHSRIENSPVGPKERTLTDTQATALQKIINEKFKQLN